MNGTSTRGIGGFLFGAASLVAAIGTARAAPCTLQSVVNYADNATSILMGGGNCTPAYKGLVSDYQNQYMLYDDSWLPWGAQAVCDSTLPFAKTVNAAWLLETGMVDYYFGWHPRSAYTRHGHAQNTLAHANVQWNLTGGQFEGLTHPRPALGTEVEEVGCQTLGAGNAVPNDPGSRAAMIIHESHHAFGFSFDNSSGFPHINGPSGTSCSKIGTGVCDYFFPHGRTAFIGKDLTYMDTTPVNGLAKAFHSPYQLTNEVNCDLTINASATTPYVVARNGKLTSNVRANVEFVNAVMYRCGGPTPMPFDPL